MSKTNAVSASTWWRIVGPSLLFSGAAVGTSHLVMSTRAGAVYGLALVGVILLVNLLKYPAYRFGVDYGHATRSSLMVGYRELGMWAPMLFAVGTFPIVPIILAAISAATAGILISISGTTLSVPVVASLLLTTTACLLFFGGYAWLDKVNRILLAFLIVSTLATTVMVLPNIDWSTLVDMSWTLDQASILFVIALAGFMPNPLDASVCQSIWTAEAENSLGKCNSSELKHTRRAFLSGYMLTALLAVCFCIMGAGVMHSGSIVLASSAPAFAAQIINLYSSVLGEAAGALAAIAALSVMLTTVMVALDITSRNITSTYQEVFAKRGEQHFKRAYKIIIPTVVSAAITCLFLLLFDFAAFLDFATSAAFVAAPIIAALNHLVVTRCAMPNAARPSPAIKALSIAAILTMLALSIAFFTLR